MTTNAAADTATNAPPHDEGKVFGWTFWMLNSIEAFERLAYFGIRAVVPIYIMQATKPGGLHLTAVHKGVIYAWWAIFQSWLPMFTGGFADRLGYKRTLAGAISMNIVGYIMMAFLHDYAGFFAGIIVLAIGTSFFKPALQGSLAQKLHKDNASMGWGIFYWVVNIGAFCAPFVATLILGKPHSAEGWRNLFLASAGFTACNLLILFTFKDVPSGADKTRNMGQVFAETVENICPFWFRGGSLHVPRFTMGLILIVIGLALAIIPEFAALAGLQGALGGTLCFLGVLLMLWLEGGDFTWQLRLPAFILIMSCFWMMMYQLWDLHPNFIEDWIDSSALAAHVPFDSWWEYGDRGLIRVPQQILLSLNAGLIILLVIPLSWLVRRMRTLSAMLIGMTVATGGVLVAGLATTGIILLVGVTFFSFGEMLTGPKKNQYLGLIAPPGKKGLYLGYVNIPIGLGVGLGSLIAGYVYDAYGEKATLALKELGANPRLAARAVQACDWSDELAMLPQLANVPRTEALDRAAEHLGVEPATAADRLRAAFRYDVGQIQNLSLLHLALHPDNETEGASEAALERLRKELEEDKNAERPEVAALRARLDDDASGLAVSGLAGVIDLLPAMVGRGRTEVLGIVQDRMNQGRPADEQLSFGQVIDALWNRYGEDPDVLANLALEYLAQNTDILARVVADMTFERPTEQLEEEIGLGRTKAFAALSYARGAAPDEVDAALAELPLEDRNDAAFVFVANLPQYRFNAVARRDWEQYLPLLQRLIADDPEAQAIVQEAAGTGEPLTVEQLATRRRVIQAALSAKDWTKAPRLAAEFLQLNPYEARALVAANLNASPLTTTRLLWDKYHPQYKVWIPFASIGVVAIIALAIFGQMAKRWGDMNA